MPPGLSIVATVGRHQGGVAQIERDGVVQSIKHVVVELDRQRAGAAVDVNAVPNRDLHGIEQARRLRRDVRPEAHTNRGHLGQPVDGLHQADVAGTNALGQREGPSGIRLAVVVLENPLHQDTRIQHESTHGRPYSRVAWMAASLKPGFFPRNFNKPSIAFTLRLCKARSSTARIINSAMTRLLFFPANTLLNFCLTSSGTLKLTVAIKPPHC